MVKFAIAALVSWPRIGLRVARQRRSIARLLVAHCGPCRQMVPMIQSLERRRIPDPAKSTRRASQQWPSSTR